MAFSTKTGVSGGEAAEQSIFFGADTGAGGSVSSQACATGPGNFQSAAAGIDASTLQNLLHESKNNRKTEEAILVRFGDTEANTFQMLAGESQRLLVELAVDLRQASAVGRLMRHASYDCSEQLHQLVVAGIAEQSFSRATWLVKNVGVKPTDQIVAALATQADQMMLAGSLFVKEQWLQLFHTVDVPLISRISSSQASSILRLALDLDDVDLARHVAGTIAMPAAQLRTTFVPQLLARGRVETAVNLARSCEAPLRTEDLERAIQHMHSPDDRAAVNLRLFATNSLAIERLPEVLVPNEPLEFAAFVLLEYRGRLFGSMSAEGGHVIARVRFQENIFDAGLSGRPEVLGGTCVHFHKESGDIVVQGKSGTYGQCDKRQASELLERAYAPLNIRIHENL